MKLIALEDGTPIALEDGTPIALDHGYTSGLDAFDLLDGRAGQFAWSIRYEYLDADRNLIDELETVAPGTIEWSSSNRAGKSLTGLLLPPGHPLVANEHRVREVWVIEGVEFEIGTFEYVGGDDLEGPEGPWTAAAAMPDSTAQLLWPLADAVAVDGNAYAVDAFAELADAGGIPSTMLELDPSTTRIGADGLVFAGPTTTPLDGLAQVATSLAWLPPHFTNADKLRGRRVPNPADEAPDFTYSSEGGEWAVILSDTLKRTIPAHRPNLYIAQTSGPTSTPIRARLALPRVGYLRPRYVDVDGAASSAQAEEALAAAARADRATTRTITLELPPDPRYDAFPIVELDETRYLGHAYRLPGDGSPMSVTIAATYADA